MLKKLRDKIEGKRNSKKLFWKSLVFAKDFIWKCPRRVRKVYFFIRVQKLITKFYSPLLTRRTEIIQIDITYACNLKCINCNRSCTQAPSSEHMTVGQIKKFIKESVDNNVKWRCVLLTGGEPTLHPDIFEIFQLLLGYKKNHSPNTNIYLFTNGYGEKVKNILSKVPKGIEICNSFKKSEVQCFCDFNSAPRDLIHYKFADYSKGCWVAYTCGIGLTPFGFYPCPIAGGIDRIFGFDLGSKKLPSRDDSMKDQLKTFCQYCGHFRDGCFYFKDGKWAMVYTWEKAEKEVLSHTWKIAYDKYKIKKPSLSLY